MPLVILGLVKYASKTTCDLSSLRRVSSGAAPLSKELIDEYRERFPWAEMRPCYCLIECCGASTIFILDKQAKAHFTSYGVLLLDFFC